MIRAGIATFAAAVALLGAGSAEALTLQPVGNFDQPTFLTSDPGDAGRLFVVEREGTIRLVEDGTTSLFADLRAEVGCAGSCVGERGLMSIALSPDFDSSGRLFVDYANNTTGALRIEELVAAGPDHDSASTATLRPLLTITHDEETNHNGGQIQFGPDGQLYVSTGDGGGADDLHRHAQDPNSPLGKILRVDPDSEDEYTLWSLGLRNPFRFSFDSLSGDMVIGDVGQGKREEVDFAPSPLFGLVGGEGANYGWNCREGLLPGPATDPQCATPPAGGYVDPVFEYDHSPDPDLGGPGRKAIIGGYVVRDPALGGLFGHYVYADLNVGLLRSLRLPATAAGEASDDCSLGVRVESPVSFGEDAGGGVYVVEGGGLVYRLAGQPPAGCPTPPAPAPGQPVNVVRAEPPADPTYVAIKAQRRRVERGKVALLTVWVSPCDGRKGQSVELLRNGRPNGTKFLSRACTARFLPRVRRGTTFTAATRGERGYLPGKSRQLTIRIAHRHHR